MADSKTPGMFSTGSSVLRGVIAAPLDRVRRRVAATPAEPKDQVNALIEGEIIPRLLMAHVGTEHRPKPGMFHPISSSDASHFALLPLRLEAASLLEEVDGFIAKGATVESICLDLLAPAARKLGEMWESDECDFLDVTMGLWRLQEVMREVAVRFPIEPPSLAAPHSALFSPMPGDQHNFGTLMIEEVFARGGWRSEALVKPERRELLDRLARQPFDLLGLTLTRDCPSSALANLIKAVRNVSANPNIMVLVGGRMISENPEIALEIGADGTGADALAALDLANAMMQAPAPRQANRG